MCLASFTNTPFPHLNIISLMTRLFIMLTYEVEWFQNRASTARRTKCHPCLSACEFSHAKTLTHKVCLMFLGMLHARAAVARPETCDSRGQPWRDMWHSCPRCWEAQQLMKTLCCPKTSPSQSWNLMTGTMMAEHDNHGGQRWMMSSL